MTEVYFTGFERAILTELRRIAAALEGSLEESKANSAIYKKTNEDVAAAQRELVEVQKRSMQIFEENADLNKAHISQHTKLGSN